MKIDIEMRCLLNGGHKYDERVGCCLCGAKITKEDGQACQDIHAPIDGLIDYLGKMDKEIKKTIEGINKDLQKDFDLSVIEAKKDMKRFGDCIEQIQLRIKL